MSEVPGAAGEKGVQKDPGGKILECSPKFTEAWRPGPLHRPQAKGSYFRLMWHRPPESTSDNPFISQEKIPKPWTVKSLVRSLSEN